MSHSRRVALVNDDLKREIMLNRCRPSSTSEIPSHKCIAHALTWSSGIIEERLCLVCCTRCEVSYLLHRSVLSRLSEILTEPSSRITFRELLMPCDEVKSIAGELALRPTLGHLLTGGGGRHRKGWTSIRVVGIRALVGNGSALLPPGSGKPLY